MTEIRLIRQLPNIDLPREWACNGGCSEVEPKLHRNVYSESWDKNGVKLHEGAEHYYTCQKGHVLEVWDRESVDYVVLPDEAYQERENTHGFTLNQIHELRKMLDEAKREFCADDLGELSEYFKSAHVSIEVIFKGQDTLTITYEYLDELEALFNQDIYFSEDAELNAICDERKDQKRVSVNIEDL